MPPSRFRYSTDHSYDTDMDKTPKPVTNLSDTKIILVRDGQVNRERERTLVECAKCSLGFPPATMTDWYGRLWCPECLKKYCP